MWDERYSGDDYAFGTLPNDFLVSMVGRLPKGKVLCLGEGEGRNATWLAQQGFDVTAVDASGVGLQKALRLAEERGVTIRVVHSDLADYAIDPVAWNAIVSVFCHLAPPLRRRVHAQAVSGLKPGGVFLLEAYRPAQLGFGTGGPSAVEMLVDLETLHAELVGLEIVHARELERAVHEGDYHTGQAAVVQVVGIKPGE